MTAVERIFTKKCKATASVELVTPEMAKLWLEHHETDNQRKVMDRRSRHYAQDMRSGLWTLSNDAICFDWFNNLINGQHRLIGIVDTGIAQPFIVARGLDPESFKVMDQGLKRNIAQFLDGSYVFTRASCLKYIVQWEGGAFDGKTVTVGMDDQFQALQDYGDGVNDAVLAVHESRASTICKKSGFMAFLIWYYHEQENVGMDKLMAFLNGVGNGANLAKGSPALTYREAMQKFDPKKNDYAPRWLDAVTIKAIKKHISGGKMSRCQFKADDSFPSLEL